MAPLCHALPFVVVAEAEAAATAGGPKPVVLLSDLAEVASAVTGVPIKVASFRQASYPDQILPQKHTGVKVTPLVEVTGAVKPVAQTALYNCRFRRLNNVEERSAFVAGLRDDRFKHGLKEGYVLLQFVCGKMAADLVAPFCFLPRRQRP